MPILGGYGNASEYAYRSFIVDYPDFFDWPDILNAIPGETYYSGYARVTGIKSKLPISITSGYSYSLYSNVFDNGQTTTFDSDRTYEASFDSFLEPNLRFTTEPGEIRNNQSIIIKLTTNETPDFDKTSFDADRFRFDEFNPRFSSQNEPVYPFSGDFNTVYRPIVSVGKTTQDWIVQTKTLDQTPDSFRFYISNDDLSGLPGEFGVVSVTSDAGDNFTLDFNSLGSYSDFESGRTYTLVSDIDFNTVIYAVGAGGGGAGGGSGGATQGKFTFLKDQPYLLRVGGTGSNRSGGYAGGGNPTGQRLVAGGGGYTGLFIDSVTQQNSILIAGGGGGGDSSSTGGIGGGEDGLGSSNGSGGGTQNSGGVGGNVREYYYGSSGSALQGGDGGAGGGGGYYGGGGGISLTECRINGEADLGYFVDVAAGGDPKRVVLGLSAVDSARICGFSDCEIVELAKIQGKRFGSSARSSLGCSSKYPSSCSPSGSPCSPFTQLSIGAGGGSGYIHPTLISDGAYLRNGSATEELNPGLNGSFKIVKDAPTITNANIKSTKAIITGLEPYYKFDADIIRGELSGISVDSNVALASTEVYNGSIINLETISPVTFDSGKEVEIKVGTFSTTWVVSTEVENLDIIFTPTDFTDQSNLQLSSVHDSNQITLTGFSLNSSIPVILSNSNAKYEIERSGSIAKSFDADPIEVINNDKIRIRLTSSDSYSSSVSTNMTIGNTSADWSISTRSAPPPSGGGGGGGGSGGGGGGGGTTYSIQNVYRFWNGSRHLCSTNTSVAGYTREGILFTSFTEQAPGTIGIVFVLGSTQYGCGFAYPPTINPVPSNTGLLYSLLSGSDELWSLSKTEGTNSGYKFNRNVCYYPTKSITV